EEHGIRARLKELNSCDERRIDTGFIFIALMFITVAVLSYAVYSISNLGVTAKTDRHIPDLKSFKHEVPASDPERIIKGQVQDKSENPPSLPLIKEEVGQASRLSFAKETVINEGLGKVISGVSQPEKEELVKKRERRFGIRVATCVLKESADAVQRDLRDKGFSSYIKTAHGSVKGKITNLYKVYTGDYNSREGALVISDRLKAKGFSAIIEEIKNGKG
ncbi:MAG: SPOR domain-containing protein, partial [Nitrospinae bacterium]|nr:SPOR domain-containing protein [Nitrospinota bacterium]